jgi:hypothetical protein
MEAVSESWLWPLLHRSRKERSMTRFLPIRVQFFFCACARAAEVNMWPRILSRYTDPARRHWRSIAVQVCPKSASLSRCRLLMACRCGYPGASVRVNWFRAGCCKKCGKFIYFIVRVSILVAIASYWSNEMFKLLMVCRKLSIEQDDILKLSRWVRTIMRAESRWRLLALSSVPLQMPDL